MVFMFSKNETTLFKVSKYFTSPVLSFEIISNLKRIENIFKRHN